MSKEYLDKNGLTYLWGKLKDYFQAKLVSGTNIKTINNQSLLGSGNITVGGGSGGGDMYKSVYDTDDDGKVDSAEDADSLGGVAASEYAQSSGLFKVVDVSVSVASISAHQQSNLGTITVPSADRPSGMTLVGIVGYQCGNYRIVPYNYYINGTHSFALAMVNTTATASAATTFTAKLLYMKATSA